MCGIVGFIGSESQKTVIKNLKRLEYRGYDSAGIAVKDNCGEIQLYKSKGEINNLEKITKINNNAILSIGHTRWATHGKPDEINAHPHVSNNGKWLVAHNGIIENYIQLKDVLVKKGYDFYSQTDTEVVAKLLEYYDNGNDLETVLKTCGVISGSYAFVIINKNSDRIYFAKNRSPLYCSCKDNETLIVSDVICLSDFNKEYYSIPDGTVGYAEKGDVKFYDKFGNVDLKLETLECDLTKNTNTYQHFMLKEIYETKSAITNIIEFYSQSNIVDKYKNFEIDKIKRAKFIGCGTAYHASEIGAKMFEKQTGIESRAYVASEFRYSDVIMGKDTLVVFISQSGETADTLAALEKAKASGALTVAVVNVEYSTLAKSVDFYFPIKAGVEVAVASTKAYCAQLIVLHIISCMFASILNNEKFILDDVKKLCEEFEFGNINQIKLLSDVLRYKKVLYMIGRGEDYFTALEAGLKIKETSYINSETYYAGELKHGFLALIEEDTYVIVFATDKKVFKKTISNAEEAKARGAKVILFTCIELEETEKENFYFVIKIKDLNNPLQCVMNIVPWQMMAYYISINKGINPDKPRNLAKSVTVE